jgi:hypothetical protein
VSSLNKNIRSIFAVTAGDYLGQFLLCVEYNSENHVFLSLPDFNIIEVSHIEVDRGINSKVLDFIEKVPSKYFKECIDKYKQVKK